MASELVSLCLAMNLYRKSAANHGIPIVPMLDILTILLIFFIVHTEFKRQVSVLPLALPQTHHLSGEKGDAQQVLLEVGADGTLALAGKRLAPDELQGELLALLKDAPQTTLQVAAADASSLGKLIEVFDAISKAGLQIDQVPLRIHYSPEE